MSKERELIERLAKALSRAMDNVDQDRCLPWVEWRGVLNRAHQYLNEQEPK